MLQGVRGLSGTGVTPFPSQPALGIKGRKRRLSCRAIALFVLALASIGQADTLWLENGDTVSGEILQLDTGQLKIKTEYAGTVDVDWRHVRAVESEQLLWVRLVGETEPQLRTLNALTTGVEVQDEDDGKVRQFSSVWAVAAIHQEKPVLADRWQFSGEVRLSIDSKMGNTNREIYGFDGEINLNDEWNKNTLEWDFETKHYSTYDVEEMMLSYSYNRFFDEHIFVVGSFDWDYELRADERKRTLLETGLGYRFWETTRGKLQTSLGLNRLWERYDINENQDDYGLVWVINYQVKIWDNLRYYNNNKLFYRFGTNERLLDMRHGFRVALNSRVSLRFSHTLDYDSQALTSVEKLDSQIKLSIGYQW